MADLLQDFFKRDLSETEMDALEKALKESPESALGFEAQLELYRQKIGLPHQPLPQSLQTLPKTAGPVGWSGVAMKWVIAAILGAGVIGAAVWKFWPNPTPVKVSASVPVRTMPSTGMSSSVKSSIAKVARPAPVSPQPASTQTVDNGLRVIVHTAQAAPVTVRILGQGGQEVRALYSGMVQPGEWIFQWDGLLPDGQSAPPGGYQIEVQSNGRHLTKDISVKP